VSSSESLGKTEELLERMRARLTEVERLADAGETDAAVDQLTEIAEIAKAIEAEIQRARQAADAGA
jgi:hypothetical protein